MTAKQSTKITVPAQVKFNGWPRDPKGGMLWLPLPEKVASLIEGTDEFAASYVCKRGTGKGFTVILATRPSETATIIAAFKALIEKPETKALATAGLRRATVEAPKWNKGLLGLRSDGWPLRAKAETAAASKTPKKGTANRKTTATPRAPRTQSPHSATVKAAETRNAQTPRKEPSRTSPDSVGAPTGEKQ